MPKLQIPERYRAAISNLRELDDTAFRALLEALRSASRPDPAGIAKAVDQSVPGAEDIVEAVFALYHGRLQFEVEPAKFLDDVVESMRSVLRDGATPEAVESLRARLAQLLSLDELWVVTKAERVLTEYERAFATARIFSDLRPVFSEDVGRGPLGMGIVHSLEIAFFKSRQRYDTFFVSLTSDDLQKLKKTIERAEAKVESLRNELGRAGVKYLVGE